MNGVNIRVVSKHLNNSNTPLFNNVFKNLSTNYYKRAKEVCHGRMGDWVRTLIQYANHPFKPHIITTAYENGKVIGFFVAEVRTSEKILYIHIICSNKTGLGTILMNTASKQARKNNLEYIALQPIEGVKNFYKKMGFSNGYVMRTNNGTFQVRNSSGDMYKKVEVPTLTRSAQIGNISNSKTRVATPKMNFG
jgi:hypothetical protein